jgi:hypothetical protein
MKQRLRPLFDRSRQARFETLEPRTLLTAGPIISEFLAANSNGLLDEDGHASDWIEIYNPTAATVNLDGWHLTDNDNRLDKWTFPSVDLPAGQFLVVFASKKDRTDVGSQLHTNFLLGSNGEYLALSQADLTVVSDFGPDYPTQFANTSYGLVANSSDTVLLDSGTAATVLVPSDGSLGTSWTGGAEPFDDSAWTSATTGVGFDLDSNGLFPNHLAGYWPLDNSAEEISGNGTDALLNGTTFDGSVPAAIGDGTSLQLDGIDDTVDLGNVGLTSGTIAMWINPTDVGAGAGDRRLLSPASGAVAQGGALGIDPGSNTGDGSLWVWDSGWQRLTADNVLQVNQWQHLALVADAGQITLYVDGAAHNTVTAGFDFDGPNMLVGGTFLQTYGNPFAGNIDDLSLWDTALTPAEIASLAGGSPPADPGDLVPLLGTDVTTPMHGTNASAYLRSEFDVADPASLSQLFLQMKYDDAFVAYLNGQEVARQNVTGVVAWNQAADQPGADENITEYHNVDISQHLPLLVSGTNVLAVHGLNASAADNDFLILPRLIDRGDAFLPGLERYYSAPTPGAPNGVVAADVGPIITQVSEPAGALTPTDPLLVTATVTPTFEDTGDVLLYYRVMFGAEQSLPMFDDGAHGDSLADDGVFGATIPAGVASAGQMLRYRVTAADSQNNTSRWSVFADPLGTPEYLGTMVDVSVTTSLPVLHWFTENTSAASSVAGTRASLFLDGEFYDNVWVHGRGAGGTNAGLKFEMNRGGDFRYSDDAPRVREFNTRSQNFGQIAEMIAYELYRDAQTPASNTFPMRFHLNGTFAGVDTFIEQVDQTYTERNGLDGDGALFKMFNSLNHPVDRSYTFYRNDNTKRTREWDPTWDLDALVAGIDENNPDRYQYVMDAVDVPAVINYLAATVLSGDYDHETHNYFVYRDNEGTGRWQVLPWDRNIAFSTVTSDPTSHPFLGSSEVVHPPWACLEGKCDEQWSRLTDAIYDNPVTREMYLRRLRTLMDELLQPPSTPLAQRKLETRLDEVATLLQSEDAGLAATATALKSKVDARRNHLYVTHSIDNVGIYPDAAGIPHAQSGNPPIGFGPIDYNPVSGNQDEEYIRLDNPNAAAVDISNWRLDGGVEHTFRPGTVIPAGGSLYVTPDVLTFLARATGPSGGQELFVQGSYGGHLSNVGETVQLIAPDDEVVATVLTPVAPSDAQLYLHVTELNYNPPGSGDLTEFIELQNISSGSESVTLDLAGVAITEGPSDPFIFPAGTSLAAGDYILVVRNETAFATAYPQVDPAIVFGPFAGSLKNEGEQIHVDDAIGGTVVNFDYDDSGRWPGRADGKGSTLEVLDTSGDYNDPDNWRSSGEFNGTPGAEGQGFDHRVVINELLTHTDPPQTDAIELFNTTDAPIDVGGWYLSDNNNQYDKFRIPDGTIIAARGYLAFDESDFNSSPGAGENGFALDGAHGDDVYLLSGDASGNVLDFIDHVEVGAALNGISYGRWPNADSRLRPLQWNSFGRENAYPVMPDLMISEISYNPPPGQPRTWAKQAGDWKIAGGHLESFGDPTGTVNYLATIDAEQTDATVDVTVNFPEELDDAPDYGLFDMDASGIIGRYNSSFDFLVVGIRQFSGEVGVWKYAGIWTEVVEPVAIPGGVVAGDDYRLSATFDGTMITVSVDGEELISENVPIDTIGAQFGVCAFSEGDQFDDFLVTPLDGSPLTTDSFSRDSTSGLGMTDELDNDLEFIEIYNATDTTIGLTGWRLRKGIDYDFVEPGASAVSLDAGETIVVLSFDPADPLNANRTGQFRSIHGIDASVMLVGPYDGKLSNNGEAIELQRPDMPPFFEPDFTPHIVTDRAVYEAVAPWPDVLLSFDSLNRASIDTLGFESASWQASVPTPGTATMVVAVPRVVGVGAGGPVYGTSQVIEASVAGITTLDIYFNSPEYMLGPTRILDGAIQLNDNGQSGSGTYRQFDLDAAVMHRWLEVTTGGGLPAESLIVGQLLGDLDGNHAIGAGDLSRLFGSATSTDITGDGATNAADLAHILAAWGDALPAMPTGDAASVASDTLAPLIDAFAPEPAAMGPHPTFIAKPTSDEDTSPRRTRRTEQGVADDGMSNRTSRRRLSVRAVDAALDDRADLGISRTRMSARAVSRRR